MSGKSGFWRVVAKLSQQRDQNTAQMRDEYLRLDEKNRRVFREWVDRLVSAGGLPVGLGVNVLFTIHLETQGVNEMESVAVCPRTLAKAMAAWDRGEDYVHNLLEF